MYKKLFLVAARAALARTNGLSSGRKTIYSHYPVMIWLHRGVHIGLCRLVIEHKTESGTAYYGRWGYRLHVPCDGRMVQCIGRLAALFCFLCIWFISSGTV